MDVRRAAVSLALALLCGGLLSACGEGGANAAAGQSRAPLPTPTPVGLELPPAGKAYLGAYVPVTVTPLETFMTRNLALDMHYRPFTALFPGYQENSDIAVGRMPVESWDCQPTNAQIIAGDDDLLITTRAQAIKNFGHPVFLRYMWDMNLPKVPLGRNQCWDPATDNSDNTFSATEFVGAWLHIRQIFAEQNVTNVIWVWSVSSAGVDPTPYYPGNTQVDWISVDAYDTNGNPDFAATLNSIYPAVSKYGKPILVSETGASPLIQPSYLQSVIPALKSQFPLVRGFMYYDSKSQGNDWTLSANGATEFKTLGLDPFFDAYGSL